ncbi:hypothetical protein SYYSPA8_08450 [Streptomyces yaizuensis]|uniref:Uncharacterized protein n=1 Tax=Streptomyces yaizuensis TaxID=2989713 RepID=A0ABQ5NVC3_9ACTN|nr:hypothetical protein SYYSPA8_08450 [Streptomyces sp. YSPA8]
MRRRLLHALVLISWLAVFVPASLLSDLNTR